MVLNGVLNASEEVQSALLKEPKGNKQDDMRGFLREKMALSEWE